MLIKRVKDHGTHLDEDRIVIEGGGTSYVGNSTLWGGGGGVNNEQNNLTDYTLISLTTLIPMSL